jgi:hypothetical protein
MIMTGLIVRGGGRDGGEAWGEKEKQRLRGAGVHNSLH